MFSVSVCLAAIPMYWRVCVSAWLCTRRQGCTCAQRCDIGLNETGDDEGGGDFGWIPKRHSVVQMLCHRRGLKHLALRWFVGWLVLLTYALSHKHQGVHLSQREWYFCWKSSIYRCLFMFSMWGLHLLTTWGSELYLGLIVVFLYASLLWKNWRRYRMNKSVETHDAALQGINSLYDRSMLTMLIIGFSPPSPMSQPTRTFIDGALPVVKTPHEAVSFGRRVNIPPFNLQTYRI